MASSIDASTSGAGGVITTADNTGILNLKTAGTNAVTIDASQNVGIGTTSPNQKLHVSTSSAEVSRFESTGTVGYIRVKNSTVESLLLSDSTNGLVKIGSISNTPVVFNTNDTERMRIDSSGNLLVGGTSPYFAERITARAASASVQCISAYNVFNSQSSSNIYSASVTASGGGWYHFIGQSGNGTSVTTNNIIIYGNGNVQNTNNSYGPISDIKVKENITDATPKLEKLMQVRVVNYNLKGELGYETHPQIGVIAQELEQVFPGLVYETPDKGVDGSDLGTTTKGVKMSVFVPMLIKAIQEQQTIINDLKARVTALEAK